MIDLTRKQKEIFEFLLSNQQKFSYPPTLNEVCLALGLSSRGSLHKHIQALIEAGLVEASDRKQKGVRLTEKAKNYLATEETAGSLPFVGYIAAGKPIEAIQNISYMRYPSKLKQKIAAIFCKSKVTL